MLRAFRDGGFEDVVERREDAEGVLVDATTYLRREEKQRGVREF